MKERGFGGDSRNPGAGGRHQPFERIGDVFRSPLAGPRPHAGQRV